MATHKVRTTIEPEVEHEVDDTGLANLKFLGILLETQATTEEGLRRAADRQVAKKNEEG